MKFRVVLICILVVFVGACHAPEVKKPRVAALLKSSTNPFFAMMWGGIKKEADERGIEIERFWPTNEANFEFQTEFLKTRAFEYDAIILAPSNPKEVRNLLPALRRAGKKIVILDEGIPLEKTDRREDYYDSFVATDNVAGGQIAAEFAKNFLKNGGDVVVFAGFDFNKPRIAAFRDTVSHLKAKVRLHEFLSDFDREKTHQIVQAHRELFKRCAVIYCANDHMALGVLEELRELHVKRLPIIIGYDSIREAIEEILRGRLAASVVQFPFKMGERGVQDIIALLRGEKVSPATLMPPRLSIRKATIQEADITAVSGVVKETWSD